MKIFHGDLRTYSGGMKPAVTQPRNLQRTSPPRENTIRYTRISECEKTLRPDIPNLPPPVSLHCIQGFSGHFTEALKESWRRCHETRAFSSNIPGSRHVWVRSGEIYSDAARFSREEAYHMWLFSFLLCPGLHMTSAC